jgi:hypothetical protein
MGRGELILFFSSRPLLVLGWRACGPSAETRVELHLGEVRTATSACADNANKPRAFFKHGFSHMTSHVSGGFVSIGLSNFLSNF